MGVRERFDRHLDVRDLLFALLCLGSVALTLLAQFAWLVVFDESGLDRAVPDAVFTTLLPALTLAALPAAAARRRYGRRAAAATAGVVFVAVAALATLTIGFFALCGRGC